jgi:hypothetical protein
MGQIDSIHYIIKQLSNQNIKSCYKTHLFHCFIWRYSKSAYICNVFFIVLDLRLTKVGVRRDSFFYGVPRTPSNLTVKVCYGNW